MIGLSDTPINAASQHGPRPLPLFLDMLRSETAADPERMVAALAGLRAYQEAERDPAPELMPVRHRAGRAVLRDYGGGGRPVVFVPSLINPPAILDLGEASLLRWIRARGHNPLLVDWGTPGAADHGLDVTAHVESLLVPLIEALAESVGEPPVLVGYCLGGTMAIAAAWATPVAGLAMLAAPWRFAGYGGERSRITAFWESAREACAMLGVVPMELLQTGFWRLDPARTIQKYEAFGRMDPGSESARAFIRLEDWANAGAPLPFAAARELFEDFIGEDLPGTSGWRIGGGAIDPAALPYRAIEFVSRNDRIVPAATAAGLSDRRELGIGHVGMIVGGRARAQLWKPLADWIAALPRARRSGKGETS